MVGKTEGQCCSTHETKLQISSYGFTAEDNQNLGGLCTGIDKFADGLT